jgi:hypothetical protein
MKETKAEKEKKIENSTKVTEKTKEIKAEGAKK